MKPVILTVIRIDYIECEKMIYSDIIDGDKIMLRHWRDWKNLAIDGTAGVSSEMTVHNKCTVFDTKLTALLPMQPDFDTAKHYAYLLTAADGSKWMLGEFRKPYPLTMVNMSMPANPTDRSGWQLTVTLSSKFPLLRVVDWSNRMQTQSF